MPDGRSQEIPQDISRLLSLPPVSPSPCRNYRHKLLDPTFQGSWESRLGSSHLDSLVLDPLSHLPIFWSHLSKFFIKSILWKIRTQIVYSAYSHLVYLPLTPFISPPRFIPTIPLPYSCLLVLWPAKLCNLELASIHWNTVGSLVGAKPKTMSAPHPESVGRR